jgi:hypothetical protein
MFIVQLLLRRYFFQDAETGKMVAREGSFFCELKIEDWEKGEG